MKRYITLCALLMVILIGMLTLAGLSHIVNRGLDKIQMASVNTTYIINNPIRIVTANQTKEIHHEPEIINNPVKVVTVNNMTERIIYSSLNYQPWQSRQEVENWLNENWGRSYASRVDCITTGNFTSFPAGELMTIAVADNRLIGLLAEYTKGDPEWHCSNFFIVGNYVYKLEPQTGGIKGVWGVLD